MDPFLGRDSGAAGRPGLTTQESGGVGPAPGWFRSADWWIGSAIWRVRRFSRRLMRSGDACPRAPLRC
jgi:hypothetical protein